MGRLSIHNVMKESKRRWRSRSHSCEVYVCICLCVRVCVCVCKCVSVLQYIRKQPKRRGIRSRSHEVHVCVGMCVMCVWEYNNDNWAGKAPAKSKPGRRGARAVCACVCHVREIEAL